MLAARLTILKPLQDETVHTSKVLALASLCIPLGACVTGAVCTATLWSTSTDDKEAQVQGTAVVMQGKVRWECCFASHAIPQECCTLLCSTIPSLL